MEHPETPADRLGQSIERTNHGNVQTGSQLLLPGDTLYDCSALVSGGYRLTAGQWIVSSFILFVHAQGEHNWFIYKSVYLST